MDSPYISSNTENPGSADLFVRPKIDGGLLFNLCLNIQTGFPLLDKPREYLDSLIPETAQFILISDNRIIHPETAETIPVETVIDTVKHSQAGIFCQKIKSDRIKNRSECCLYATSLGKNRIGKDLAAAILIEKANDFGYKDYFCELLSTVRDFIVGISNSRAIESLMNQRSTFRYVIDADTNEMVAKRIPVNSAPENERLAESFFTSVLFGNRAEQKEWTLDDSIKNYNITRFRLQRFEFILLSFEIVSNPPQNESGEFNQFIQDFVHRIKNKLSSLQAAVGQWNKTSGGNIDKNDLALIKTIQTESDFIDKMVSRLEQYCNIGRSERQSFNLNELINRIVDDSKTEIDFTPDSTMPQFTGDIYQIESAIREIIYNARESGHNVSIKTDINDSINIHIKNRLSNTRHSKQRDNIERLEKPFIPLNSERTGLGLSFAKKIISKHNGTIENLIGTDHVMTTKITLPL